MRESSRRKLGCFLLSVASVMGAALMVLPKSAGASAWPSRATRLERELGSENVETRLLAARALGGLAPALAKEGLSKALSDPEQSVRLVAARTAVSLRLSDLGVQVKEWLSSKEAVERRAAIELLSIDVNSEKVTLLGSALADPVAEVRLAAVLGLGRARAESGRAATAMLLGALDDADVRVRREAAAALGMVGSKDAALTMAAHLQDPETSVRQQLALAVGVLGDESVAPALLVALSDPEDAVVAAAATALGFLNSGEAVAGLSALSEQVPFRESGQRAIESLVRLGGDREQSVVLELLSRADRRRFIEFVLTHADGNMAPFLERCVRTSAGEALLACMRVALARDESVDTLLGLLGEGRLSSQQILSIFATHPTQEATVLALEMLANPRRDAVREALSYLEQQESLPREAEGPLRESLRSDLWSPQEVAVLLQVLAKIEGGGPAPWVEEFLESTQPDVQKAAAQVLVARGVAGEKLRALLFRGPEAVRSAALEALSRAPTEAQAATLIALLAEGTHGNRRALLSVFWAFPEDLPSKTLVQLEKLVLAASGPERDSLLVPWIRAKKGRLPPGFLGKTSVADRLRLAQLAWYTPRAEEWTRSLARSEEGRIAAAALVALGLRGEAKDAKLMIQRASARTRPTYLRAAAYTAVGLLFERQIISELPPALDTAACKSEHPGLRAAALRLFAQAEKSCGSPLEEVLLLDPDPRLRATAADILGRTNPTSMALRRCALYESRTEVASHCGFTLVVGKSRTMVGFSSQSARSSGLPVRQVTLSEGEDGRRRRLVPLPFRFSPSEMGYGEEVGDFIATLVSDRDAHLLVPDQGAVPVDVSWAY